MFIYLNKEILCDKDRYLKILNKIQKIVKKARKLSFSHTFVDSDFNLNNHAVGHANKTYISA